jgi:hypothetical protein
MAHPGLEQLVENPDGIVTIPPAEIPRLIGDAEALKARLWARLQECTASATAARPVQNGNGSHRLLTAGQAAERLDVTLARLYELVRTGTLPAVSHRPADSLQPRDTDPMDR